MTWQLHDEIAPNKSAGPSAMSVDYPSTEPIPFFLKGLAIVTDALEEVSRAADEATASALLDGVDFSRFSRDAFEDENGTANFAVRRSIYARFALLGQLDCADAITEHASAEVRCSGSRESLGIPLVRSGSPSVAKSCFEGRSEAVHETVVDGHSCLVARGAPGSIGVSGNVMENTDTVDELVVDETNCPGLPESPTTKRFKSRSRSVLEGCLRGLSEAAEETPVNVSSSLGFPKSPSTKRLTRSRSAMQESLHEEPEVSEEKDMLGFPNSASTKRSTRWLRAMEEGFKEESEVTEEYVVNQGSSLDSPESHSTKRFTRSRSAVEELFNTQTSADEIVFGHSHGVPLQRRPHILQTKATDVRHRQTSATLEAVNMASPRLRAVVDAFNSCDTSGANKVSASDIALYWAACAEHRSKRAVNEEERCLIAADVQLFFGKVDVFMTGHVGFDEWLHHFFLEAHSPGSAALLAINRRLRAMDDLSAIPRLVRLWLKADAQGEGHASLGDIVGALYDEDDVLDADIVFATFGKDIRARISYPNFVAQQISLDASPVVLLYYDLSHSFAKYLTPLLLWRLEEGVWHTGLSVFGHEYYYFGGIWYDDPGETAFGKPTKSLVLGHTFCTDEELHEHINTSLRARFKRSTYDAFTNNCNHLCDSLTLFLLGRHIPDQVRFLPNRLLGTPVARLLRPLLNRWLCGEKSEEEEEETEDEPAVGRLRGSDPNRRSSITETHIGLGDLVLFEGSVSSDSVVAKVVEAKAGGRFALSWLDSSGRRRISRGVPAWQVTPYEVGVDDQPSRNRGGRNSAPNFKIARVIYSEAARALGASISLSRSLSPGFERQRRRSRSPSSSMLSKIGDTAPSADGDLAVGEVVSLSKVDRVNGSTQRIGEVANAPSSSASRSTAVKSATCSLGHQWKPKMLSFWQGRIHSRCCSECGSHILRNERRMWCKRCKTSVCERCWGGGNSVMRFALASFDGDAGISAAPRCLRGHVMERLAGQELRAGAVCKQCRTKELGATAPYFFSCRPCRYDLCVDCADRFPRVMSDTGCRSHSHPPALESRSAQK
eukprot:TRINITY_DN36990_c0_g1_i1.p1 TRINITY_DN36990_c0_g1~~TRINITY_DN36990_c0_g1_i1.p1  ORF type:complete len:1061 (+),score=140.18 TRINITY_DN36990_c0_g1_i1:283-3465(+)